MGFDEMEPIFGRLNAEWSAPDKTPLKPFLFHVHGLPSDPSTLCVCATDFHSNTWNALKSAQELEDMGAQEGAFFVWLPARGTILTTKNLKNRRITYVSWCFMDRCSGEHVNHLLLHCKMATQLWPAVSWFGVKWVMPSTMKEALQSWALRTLKRSLRRDRTGIGGSWSDFVDYLIASVKSEDVKLVMDGQSKVGGAAHAKLVGQKAKGMPRIAISLSKLVDTAATDAMANLSLELYKTFTNVHNLLKAEQQRCSELTNVLSEEKEKNETAQKQLDALLYLKRQKVQKITGSTASDTATISSSLESPAKQAAQLPSTKATNRVVPAHRRARVRGVLLHDIEDERQE